MLSEYINCNQAYFNGYNQILTLSYTDQPLIIDQLPLKYRGARSVAFNHCHLTSLEGIEQFQQLEEFSFKYNKIEEVEELERIQNKDGITKLDFSGNDVQYLGGAMFIHLKKIFPQLIELNGRNYAHLLLNKKRGYPMKKILAETHKIQKQLVKTVKTSGKTHNNQIRSLRSNEDTCQKERNVRRKMLINTDEVPEQTERYPQRYEEQQQYKSSCDEDEEQTSRVHQQSRNYDCQLKENPNFTNMPQNNISLGGISHISNNKTSIPMIKSIKASSNTDNHPKGKGLKELALNQSLSNHQLPVQQPTATFANQRARQNASVPGQNFMFKNKHRYSDNQFLLEQSMTNSKMSQYRPKKQNFDSYLNYEGDSEIEDSFVEDNLMSRPLIQNIQEQWRMGIAYSNYKLKQKAFKSLKLARSKNMNLPKKLYFA